MNTLFKLTLVSVAILKSGLMGIDSAQADEVVFFEERKSESANTMPINDNKNQIDFTVVPSVPVIPERLSQETAANHVRTFLSSTNEVSFKEISINAGPTDLPVARSAESVISTASAAATKIVEYSEISMPIELVTAVAVGEVIPATSAVNEVIFLEEKDSKTSTHKVQLVTDSLTKKAAGQSGSDAASQVQFAEEPRLAAARPARRQLEGNTEALEALRAQIRSKAGSSNFKSTTERNRLALLRESQESGDTKQQQGRLILLTNVEVEGNTVVDDATLAGVSASFVGRRIMLSELEELRVQLTKVYTENGFINSGVVLPDQKVENGNIVYNAVEGTIAELNIEGSGSLKEKYITDRLMVDSDEPFNSNELQENFQLLLDDPLFDRMDGKLRSLPGKGLTALDLTVARARPYDFSVTTSNHGTPSLGEGQVFVSGIVRNVSGNGDLLGLTAGGNGSKFSITSEYELPVRSDDTRVIVRLTGTNSSVVEEPLDSIDIESSSLGADLSMTRPLKRSIRESVIAGTGISIRKSNNSLEDVPFSFSPGEEDGRSKVAVARLWRESIHRGDQYVLATRATLNLGLDMFGSTIHDDGRPDSDFLSGQAQIQYARKAFDDRAQVILKLEGQMTNGELLPLERFALGGADTIRGYRENEIVRDQIALASAELQYPFYRSADFGTFQLAPFFDIGYGKNKTFFTAEQFLASVGLGLLWDLGAHISGELYLGAGLKDTNNSRDEVLQDQGIHLKVVARY